MASYKTETQIHTLSPSLCLHELPHAHLSRFISPHFLPIQPKWTFFIFLRHPGSFCIRTFAPVPLLPGVSPLCFQNSLYIRPPKRQLPKNLISIITHASPFILFFSYFSVTMICLLVFHSRIPVPWKQMLGVLFIFVSSDPRIVPRHHISSMQIISEKNECTNDPASTIYILPVPGKDRPEQWVESEVTSVVTLFSPSQVVRYISSISNIS